MIHNIFLTLLPIFSFDKNSPLLFTQFYFWAFFAIVFAFFALLHRRILLRNTFLLFVSLFFYYKTSGSYVCLLIFAIVANFLGGKLVYKLEKPRGKKAALAGIVALDLFTLAYFKYAYFFLNLIDQLFGIKLQVYNFFALAGNALFRSNSAIDTIVLPVGISFFVFQAISYCVDIYRKTIKPVNNLLDFGFYLTFFPQLVAGPIVRANKFIPQLHKKFFLPKRTFGIAVFWILNGLAKKIIMSDYLASNFVDRVFESPLLFSGFENLLALFAYSLQVYADFSGYTDIAIGVALLMGFRLPKNFNSPYKAQSPAEFWHRWHISLSSWLRDYLYIPLGGNRGASFGTFFWIAIISAIAIILSGSLWIALGLGVLYVYLAIFAYFKRDSRKNITTHMNAMTTQLLGGLWHGASWNFMIWGGLNGIGMIVQKVWVKHSIQLRAILIFIISAGAAIICKLNYHPLLAIIAVWSGIIFVGVYANMIFRLFTDKTILWIRAAWNIGLTFTFITSTRLFFRSGSNLDPAEANQVAWETATNMINQIGNPWEWMLVPKMATEYANIIGVFAIGMIIHWLPDNFKRRYRITFASIPMPLLLTLTASIIFIIYQFVTADSQPFIYFQF